MQSTTTIKITECYGEHAEAVSTHRTADINEAIERACSKRYGKRTWLVVDVGLNEAFPKVRFGQMVKPCDKRFGGLNCITGRICIEVL